MGSSSLSFTPLLICQAPCEYLSVYLFSTLQSSCSFCQHFIELQDFSGFDDFCPITLGSSFALVHSVFESYPCFH